MSFVGPNAGNALRNVLDPAGFDQQYHVFAGAVPRYAKETGELRLNETAVKSKLATLKNLGFGQCYRRGYVEDGFGGRVLSLRLAFGHGG